MIVIVPKSKLQLIVAPDLLACRERLLVCLATTEGRLVIMGLAQYCLTIHRSGALDPAHRTAPGSASPGYVRTLVRPSGRTSVHILRG